MSFQAAPKDQAASPAWRIARIDSLAGMEAVAEQWRALEERAKDSLTFFQSYDWCRTWCGFYASQPGEGPCIRIYAAYQGERLIFVWPLMIADDSWSIRRLVALTVPHGQYGNVLVDADVAACGTVPAIMQSCCEAIRDEGEVDAVSFASVPAGAVPGRLRKLSKVSASRTGVISAMELARFGGSYEAYRKTLKSTTRRARNKRRNKLAALGELGYEVHMGGSDAYAALAGQAVSMKRQWLQRTGRATRGLNTPHVAKFLASLPYRPAVEGRHGHGAIAAALTLDGRPIAIEIGFLYHGRFYSYLGAFDWQLRAYSPGKVQLEEALRWCIEHGVKTFDLLGDPSGYKVDWCNTTMPLYAFQEAHSFTGKAYLDVWQDRLRPALKRSFESLPLAVRARLLTRLEAAAEPLPQAASR